MAIYYHASTDLQHNGEFIPRIPDCRHQDQEDSVTPRISVAPSIEDCLTAIPNGGGRLDELNIQLRGYYLIYKIDTEKLGISEKDMILSDVLYEKDLVRDAEITNEVWITTPFVVPEEDRFFIKLISWEETAKDIVPYSIYDIADKEYEGNYVEAYETIYDKNVPCSVKIIEPIYIHEEVKEGEEVSIYFEDEEEKEMVQEFIGEHYEVEMTTEYMDELTFDMKKNGNLRNLFLYHKSIIVL
ncbi:hypothetical protein CVD28_02430 [Bacillus sp. M6-12]|uniref:hypothetical protein n=1 Tax=Bacillus sp. M6-12 TaxID=2054166 RepID=UPI000C77A007|nr:hypothetical protein [Bacillus sp. M6-12]PLS19289.1 hypothetical protein CVD28_02430 [Bacillus sp. M6-12]